MEVGVQGHPQLHRELEVSLDHPTLSKEKRKGINTGPEGTSPAPLVCFPVDTEHGAASKGPKSDVPV